MSRFLLLAAATAALALPMPAAGTEGNLLENPGFEAGKTSPTHWESFSPQADGVSFVWEEKGGTGARCVGIARSGRGLALWRQTVGVEGGRVYTFAAHVAFADIAAGSRCCLRVVFRDAANGMPETVDLPGHTGSREFALDFPPRLQVRAPREAVRAEVNLLLEGEGKAWFDDVFFGPSPTGEIAGRVTGDGKPLPGVRVRIWGDPWGEACEARTDAEGQYRIPDVPVTFPRYVLLAEKAGYRSRPLGNVAVGEGAIARADFVLEPGTDPDDLQVRFGTLAFQSAKPGARIPSGATIPADAGGYPERVRPYLASDPYIRSDHPDVVAKAREIVAGLRSEERADTRKVVWAVYEWVCKNIEHDGVYDPRGGEAAGSQRDVTTGIWQTISGEGWCWGKSFLDWCYRPHELLATHGGICVEHAWLTSALLRAVNIPARASVGSMEYWAQSSPENGVWVHGGTTAGRTRYREEGVLGPGFEGVPEATRYSVLSRPILHEDWNAGTEGLWRERHPWSEQYDGTEAGWEQARSDLARFASTGRAPRGSARPPGPRGPRANRPSAGPDREGRGGDERDLITQRQRPPLRRETYAVHYSDVTISLLTLADGEQKTLDVRFPLVTATGKGTPETENAFWTNHSECVKRTWVEDIANPPAVGMERWFHVEFDLEGLLRTEVARR